MSWAGHRRALIFALVAVVLTFLAAVTGISFWYKAPSCNDGVKNQDEAGIDCGGSCALLCTSQVSEPTIRFERAVANEPGRVDFIAYIDNPNPKAASRNAVYDLDLYDAKNLQVAVQTGTIELPPNATTPLFIPGLVSGDRVVSRAFLTFRNPVPFEPYADDRILPTVAPPVFAGTLALPRITDVIGNPAPTTLANVKLVVTVFDANGTAIAASQTILPSIAPNSTALATFTWNVPWSAPAARIEVIPVVPL